MEKKRHYLKAPLVFVGELCIETDIEATTAKSIRINRQKLVNVLI